ncbi:MAG: c-type cytochrome [Bacteroidota bacterium]
MSKMFPFLGALCFLFLMACGDQANSQTTTQANSEAEAAPPAPVVSIDEATMTAGKQVYDTYCIACHMASGNGVPDMNPPLTDPEWIEGDPERLITLTLNGLSGPIEVNGDTYDNIMTPHNFLTDEQIAQVLTYIRNSFGHSASEVLPEQVATIRAKSE